MSELTWRAERELDGDTSEVWTLQMYLNGIPGGWLFQLVGPKARNGDDRKEIDASIRLLESAPELLSLLCELIHQPGGAYIVSLEQRRQFEELSARISGITAVPACSQPEEYHHAKH